MEPKTKEFIWGARLSKENKMVKWGGRQDGVLEQIILKLAVLGPGASKDERNIVEITSFDSEQKKKKAIICSLELKHIECQPLGDLSLFPPANFTLIEGSGPVEVVASHIILDEDDLSDEDDDEDFEESIEDLREKLKAKRVGNGKSSKKSQEEEEDGDDYEDMDDEDDDDEEIDEEEMKKAIKKMKAELIDDEAEESDEDDEEDEEVEEAPTTKKRKLTNGKSESTKKNEAKLTSPERTKKAPEQKTPKTPQNKKDAPKTPKSEKKTPAKPKFDSVEDVKAAIKKFPGGKPRKQDKFGNWIENTFKVSDDTWKNELWNWHKKDIGL